MRKSKNRISFLIFLAPSFAGVIVFVLTPFADVLKRSFETAVTGRFTGAANQYCILPGECLEL